MKLIHNDVFIFFCSGRLLVVLSFQINYKLNLIQNIYVHSLSNEYMRLIINSDLNRSEATMLSTSSENYY